MPSKKKIKKKPLQEMEKRYPHMLSCVQLFAISWTVACQAPVQDSPGKNAGVGCHFLFQGNLLNPGIEHTSPMFPALAGGFFTTEPHWYMAHGTYGNLLDSLCWECCEMFCLLIWKICSLGESPCFLSLWPYKVGIRGNSSLFWLCSFKDTYFQRWVRS